MRLMATPLVFLWVFIRGDRPSYALPAVGTDKVPNHNFCLGNNSQSANYPSPVPHRSFTGECLRNMTQIEVHFFGGGVPRPTPIATSHYADVVSVIRRPSRSSAAHRALDCAAGRLKVSSFRRHAKQSCECESVQSAKVGTESHSATHGFTEINAAERMACVL